MSKFQIILLAVFGVIGIVAVLMFGGIIPGYGGGKGNQGNQNAVEVIVWGPLNDQRIDNLVTSLNTGDKNIAVKYIGKSMATYESDFINALATNTGPDVWMVTQELLLKHKDKLFVLPFTSYSERTFLDTFADIGEVFFDRKQNGIIGFPLVIDPMVFYWNRSLFASAGISSYPTTWDEFLNASQSLTKLDAAGNVVQSGAALGDYKNIRNAKGILSTLFLQEGNPIIQSGNMEVALGGNTIYGTPENALKFFDEFSNPSKANYSWNRSLPRSDIMFTNSSLAMYLGYASEIVNLRAGNPHLEFDVAVMPQIKDKLVKTTHARVYALAIPKNAKNRNNSMAAINKMTSKDFNAKFSALFNLGSSRRDVLGAGSGDSILSVVYRSSIMAKTWLEPDEQIVPKIFQNMVDSTVIGRTGFREAIVSAGGKLRDLMRK